MEDVRYLIVGGGLAGGSAVEAIRERDREGRIILVASEPHLPYDRVPLSKQYLMGRIKREQLFLQNVEFYKQAQVEILTASRVERIDLTNRIAVLDGGRELHFDRILLATGGRPRHLPIPGDDLPGIFYLRTIDDSEAIQEAIAKAKRAVIVGGGFIGSEIAAACAQKGVDTTIIEAQPTLLNAALDPETARWVTQYFEARGVHVLTNAKAARFIGENGRVTGIELTGGEKIPGDFVAVGIGIQPNTELAKEAGLPVENGIVVGESLEVDGRGVYAAGDVANFSSPVFKKHLRVEHYDVAVKHGRLAGANMAGAHESFMELPYFFSYLFKLRIEVWGDTTQRELVVRRGPLQLTEKGGFAQFYLSKDIVQAYVSVNRPSKDAEIAQKLIQQRKKIQNAPLLRDDSFELSRLVS